MSIFRTSSQTPINNGIYHLQNNLSVMSKLQRQLATGKNIAAPSDNPIGITQLLRLDLEASRDEQYTKNVEEGISELNTTDSALSSLNNLLSRAREIAVQASNATNSPEQLQAIKSEAESLVSQAVQIANTSIGGRYIFSGYRTDDPPFELDEDNPGTVNYQGSPADEDYQRSIQVGKNLSINLNLNGEDVFGSVEVSGGVASGSGILQTLTQLKLDIDNANYDGIRDSIDSIKSDQSRVLQFQADIGGRSNQLEALKTRLEDRKILNTQQVSSIQDVDIPSAISKLNYQQTIYQASIGVMGNILQSTSALQYLL